jgi:purine-nucleoside phosphorylase
MTGHFELAAVAARQLAERSGVAHHDVAVILGSGWAPAADRMGEVVTDLSVTELAGFAVPAVTGHASTVRSIAAGPRRILVFLGRVHLYEGHPEAAVVHAVRTAVFAGCRVVVLTNAAGAVNPGYAVGQPVLIADHINLTGRSPLTGPTPPPPFDARFVDMTTAYSARLRGRARVADPSLAEGVYAAFAGPQFETPAEVRMAGRLGADLVGMSTVLETIAARHMGAEVLACSLVTNMAAGLEVGGIDHEDVMAVGRHSARQMGSLLADVMSQI